MQTHLVKVLWLSGNRIDRQHIISKAKASFGDCEILQVDDISYDALEGYIINQDCFAEKMLIILSSLPFFTCPRPTFVNRMKKLLDSVSDNCLVIFNGIPASSERAISAHVAKIGKLFEFTDEFDFDHAVTEVRQKITKYDKSIEEKQAMAFVRGIPSLDSKTWNIDQVRTAILKLVCFTEKRKVITTEDVTSVSTSLFITTPWVLFEAIDAKDFDLALLTFHRLVKCQGEGKPVDFVHRFLHLALWRFKLLAFIKESQMIGKSNTDIVADALSLRKYSEAESKEPTYGDRHIQIALGSYGSPSPLVKYTRKRLVAIVEFLQEIQEHIRGIVGEISVLFLVEVFLLLACEKIDDKRKSILWDSFQHE